MFRNTIDREKVRLVYKVIAEYILSYGIIRWSGEHENALNILRTNQNSLIAFNSDSSTHTIDLYKNFHVPLQLKNRFTKPLQAI